jgi:G3E family GTPase
MTTPARFPVTLLTGFLGSGKTSLLQAALADPRMAKTAVIINEVGEVGLDHLLLGKLDDDAILLKSGCLCCSLKNGFSETLQSLRNRRENGQYPPFERVIVETTGLADPVPLLKMLLGQEPVNSWYSVRGVVTTLDTLIRLDTASSRTERIRQLALADHIILTKTDLSTAEQIQDVRAHACEINGRAQYLDNSDSEAVMRVLLDPIRYPVVGSVFRGVEPATRILGPLHASATAHEAVGTFAIYADEPLHWDRLVRFFRELAKAYGSRLLRLKGLVNIADCVQPVVVHGVEQFLFPERYLDGWPDSDHRTRLVFIAENIDPEQIDQLFKRYALRE